jgi:hypothetical protein
MSALRQLGEELADIVHFARSYSMYTVDELL